MSELPLPDKIIAQLDRRFWETVDQEREAWLTRDSRAEKLADHAAPSGPANPRR